MNNKDTFYAKLSEYYDKIFPLSKGTENFILQELANRKQPRILDIGCGTGSLSIALSLNSQVKAVTALDLDDEMISKAMRKNVLSGTSVDFRILNMLNIESCFGCSSFDTIICLGNTIAHLLKIEDVESFLKAAACVLVPGGVLILQGLNYNYILEENISALPLIENDGIQFIRNYNPSEQTGLLEFKTEIRIQDGASVSGFTPAVSDYTLHNPIRPELLQTLIKKAGFSNLQLFGGFDRSVFSSKSLPLVITCIKD
ncbi:MAG: class I SAM-dependent methyltransferase [Bacteroidetes bacterium]|nr:class I SAM-dependent methyltransferase [Bacteroidota bacterium]